jgi:hypothetical protein
MKIALIGSAPSSVMLAPYADTTWTIWGCSPGAAFSVKRADAWFEIHPLADAQVFTADYVEWLRRFAGKIYVTEPTPSLPQSEVYPREALVEKYGPYFFTSSLSWMFAFALEQPGIEEIGLWGVDMSATEEYSQQRPGCHYFMTIAKARGIKVTVPPESDLMQPPMQYGFSTASPMYRKLRARKTELDRRIDAAAAAYEHHRNEWHFLRGARDDLDYMLNTWVE